MVIVILVFIAAFPIGFILIILFCGYDKKLEDYYKETVVKEVSKPQYLPKSMFKDIPKEIIVDSRHAYSPLRVFLKKQIARILRKGIPEVLIVFGAFSEAEQKAFLIQKAFSSSVTTPLLDFDFIETLIYYLAHKYASANPLIEEEVKAVLRKNFENSTYRDCVLKLDSLEYSAKIVINPPPLKKPLLTNVVFPMVKEQEKKLFPFEEVAEIETWKYFFTRIIDGFHTKKCAVLFIGARRDIEKYADMLLNGLHDFNSVIVSARGLHLGNMVNVISHCCYIEESEASEERVLTSCERIDIDGVWEFPYEEIIACRWTIFTHKM